MEKTVHCKCKTRCETYRCQCLKHNEPCDDQCGCVECANPLNGVDVGALSVCALQNIRTVKALTEEQLAGLVELPCGHESVPLRLLLGSYDSARCGEAYWYSFCWGDAAQDNSSWHCEVCHQCRDWREWHCPNCNRCTYGVTFACEHCGNVGGPLGDVRALRD